MIKRIFKICLCIALIGSQSFAQNVPVNPMQPTQNDIIFVIDNFSPLLNGHSSPYTLTHGEATDAYNVRGNDEFSSLAKRPALNTYGTCGHSSPVTGLYRYYKSDGTKYTITSSSTFLDYISDSGSCTNLLAGLSSGARWNFQTYKNNVIATDGLDLPQKWDGTILTTADTTGARSAGFLTTQLGAPFAQLAAGSGLTASKWYHYVIAYNDGTNYWYSTAQSNPIQMGATNNKQVLLNGIPLGPAATLHRYIYRTLADNTAAASQADTTYYLDQTINDNTTTSIADSSSDSTISSGGGSAPTWATVTAGNLNVTPPHGTYPFINQGYFTLANDQSGVQYGQSTVYFSAVGNPDYFPATSFFLIRPDDGDSITFNSSFLGVWTIGKTNTISKIYTSASSPTSWSVSQPFSFIGCIAPYSAVSTPIGIIYLGRYGLYQFDGQSSHLISDTVSNDILDINQTNLSNVDAVTYKNEYRMAYASSATGSGSNNRVLLYDMIRNNYEKDTENINVWTVFNSNSDFGGLYSGSSLTDGNILAHSTQPTQLIERYLSDLNLGTFSATGAFGTQGNPTLSLAAPIWSSWSTHWNSMGSATWTAVSSPGTWLSPIVQVNANALSKLYWNSILPVGTSATMAIRTGSSPGAVSAAAWSSEFTNPAGSDISGVSANTYIQMRVTFSSSNLAVTPSLYVQDNYMIQLVYSQVGNVAETNIPTVYSSGWLDLVTSPYLFYMSNIPKVIKEIDIYYEGTSGTMNVNLQNLKGDSTTSFSFDMSQAPVIPQTYWGGIATTSPGAYSPYKMYRWLPGMNDINSASIPPNGDKFMLTLSESGVVPWRIQRIAIRYDLQPYRPYANN